MNSSDIKKRLRVQFGYYDYKLYNTYIYSWESDFFAISKSGYSVEVEIKISRGDFNNDYKKTVGYSGKNKHEFLIDKTINKKPNKFYFACPEGLINLNEINENYGLIYVDDKHNQTVIKQAKYLHKDKILESPIYLRKLLDKFYWRNMQLRQSMNLIEEDIYYGQTRINELNKYFR